MGSKMDFELDITGHAGDEVESAYTPNGKMFSKVSVAVDVGYGEYNRTEWVDVVVWGEKPATNFANMVQKGTLLRVVGEPKINAYINKKGEVKASFDLSCREFKILGKGKPKSEESETPYDE